MIRPGRPDGATDETDLVAGLDFRKPEYRRETFLRFYEFHLRHRAHPGGVYHLIPYLRERLGWDDEEALWYAFLNGNTQHPVTSLILHDACPRPTAAGLDRLTDRFYTDYARLSFDTDRRHHKKSLLTAVSGYLSAVGSSQLSSGGTMPSGDSAASGRPRRPSPRSDACRRSPTRST